MYICKVFFRIFILTEVEESKEVFNKIILKRFKALFFFRLTFYCKRQNNQNKALKSIKKTARPPPGLLSIFFFFVFLFFFFGLFSERTFWGFQPNKPLFFACFCY
jgi:ABC-type uncharacterized transport system permease subunit